MIVALLVLILIALFPGGRTFLKSFALTVIGIVILMAIIAVNGSP